MAISMAAAQRRPDARKIRVGVIGTGALGQHHVRILSELPEAELVGLFDTDAARAAEVAGRFGAEATSSAEELVNRTEAVVLAVPTVDHARLGAPLLERGIHLLVEKPIAASLEEADSLLAAAERGEGDPVLAVGHVEYYNPAVQALMDMDLQIGFAEIHRMGVFSPRSLDIDVVLDLMIHDLQILQALERSELEKIHAVGVRVLSEKVDIANVRLQFASGCVANLTASRVSAEKIRKLRLFAPPGYYSVDYQTQEVSGFRLEEVDSALVDESDLGAALAGKALRSQDLSQPRAEPLKRELESFLAACRGEPVRYVGGAGARLALATAHRVLEQIG